MINKIHTKCNQPIIIAEQTCDDVPSILQLHSTTFNRADEPRLVETLSWQTGFNPTLSRVAKLDNKIVGHILFTELYADSNMLLPIVALAPMAVLPEYQRQGVGGALIDDGFALLAKEGYAAIVVSSDTGYYTRQGFTQEKVAHIRSPYQGKHYMGYELLEGAFSNITEIRYPAAFTALDNKEVLKVIAAQEGDVVLPTAETLTQKGANAS